jgi:RNA polymerase sigma-70 factor (ECF subfamily)
MPSPEPETSPAGAYADDPGVRAMLAWQAGDEASFDTLVELYSGQVFALFTRFLGQVPEREDLVQEVFLRVLRSRARYTPTARFSTYLYRVSFNLAVNHTERDKNSRSLDGNSLDDDELPGRTPAAEDGDPIRKLIAFSTMLFHNLRKYYFL